MGIDMVLDSFARARFSQDHARHTLHEVVRSGKSRRHYRSLNDPLCWKVRLLFADLLWDKNMILWLISLDHMVHIRALANLSWSQVEPHRRSAEAPRSLSIGSYGGTKWNGHFAEVKALNDPPPVGVVTLGIVAKLNLPMCIMPLDDPSGWYQLSAQSWAYFELISSQYRPIQRLWDLCLKTYPIGPLRLWLDESVALCAHQMLSTWTSIKLLRHLAWNIPKHLRISHLWLCSFLFAPSTAVFWALFVMVSMKQS
jgi:hypothetical protein